MNKLHTINAEELQNRTYEPTHFLVDELIPEGLHILAGAPKIGKSWLALWLCLCVSQGQPLWNFAVTQGEVLYLSLEDSFQRIQTRLFDLTEDAPPTLHFAIMADTLKHGLEQQIEQFLAEHPNTKLVVIDTLQRVRSAGSDSNLYANDYPDFHNTYAKGKVTLTCCMETDFDVMTKLSQIFLHNSIKSVSVAKTDKSCCGDLSLAVMRAAKSSKLPIPVQVSSIFIDAEDVSEDVE